MSLRLPAALIAICLALLPQISSAQKMVQLTHQPPNGALVEFLLTDGTVMVQSYSENTWYKLTPDNTGSYVNGTWSQLASLPSGYQPLYFASAVLADGKLVIAGGEYNFDQFAFTNMGAVYDPTKDSWLRLQPPKGWKWIGDSPSAVLPNGEFTVGQKFFKRVASLDPSTLKWMELSSKHKNDWNAEEGWMLLPTGHILTWDVKANPLSEEYDPKSGKWTNLGNTGQNLQGPCEVCNCIEVPPRSATRSKPRPTIRLSASSTARPAMSSTPRTHGHSTMGVATGAATVSTHFDVPKGMETGARTVEVVANGIPSTAVSVTVQ